MAMSVTMHFHKEPFTRQSDFSVTSHFWVSEFGDSQLLVFEVSMFCKGITYS